MSDGCTKSSSQSRPSAARERGQDGTIFEVGAPCPFHEDRLAAGGYSIFILPMRYQPSGLTPAIASLTLGTADDLALNDEMCHFND